MDETETVGLGQLADKIHELSDLGAAGVTTMTLDRTGLPAGMLIEDPRLLVIQHGDGKIVVESVLPHIEKMRGKPFRRAATARATTLASFCALVNRNGDDGTVLFVDANWRAPKLLAVLNYNTEAVHDADIHPEAAAAGDDPLARFGDHRVAYDFPLSEAWKAWVAMNGKEMGPAEFAAFLEDHVHELAVPDTDGDSQERDWEDKFRTRIATPNELVDLARGLEITVGAKIKTKTKLQTGETTLVFETEHRSADGGELTVPGLFVARLPIFYRGADQRVLVRLRYRPAGEKGVVWAYEIFRPDEVVDERIRADVADVAYQTGRDVLDGAPEETLR